MADATTLAAKQGHREDDVTVQVERDLQDGAAASTVARADSSRRRRVAMLSAAGALLVAAAVATVLVVYLQPRRTTSIAVPKTFAARFTTVSKLDSSIAYDGQVFKTEDDSGTWNWQVVVQSTTGASGARSKMVYTLINGAAYRQEVDVATGAVLAGSCMTADEIPPLQDLSDLFTNGATMANSEFDQDAVAECAGEDKQKVVLQWGPPTYRSQNAFVYCGVNDGTHRFISHQYVASVFNIDTAPPAEGLGLATPVDGSSQALSCPVIVTPSMLTGMESSLEARQLAAANAWYAAAAYARRLNGLNAPSKTCVFVAGSGQTSSGSPATSLPGYWGPVHALVTAKCLTQRFIRRNMRDNPFSNSDYQAHFCAQVDTNGDRDIDEDVFIFSHGTGSLLVAAALANRVCEFASDTNSKWWAAGSPMKGSPVASGGTTLCKSEQTAMGTYMARLGICRADNAARSAAMTALATESLDDYRDAYDEFVTGVMCGTDPLGQSVAGKSDGVLSVGDYVSFSSSNHDGFTTLSGCTPEDTTLETDYTKKNYRVPANTLDLTCRGGDAVLDLTGNRSPCSWYRERAS